MHLIQVPDTEKTCWARLLSSVIIISKSAHIKKWKFQIYLPGCPLRHPFLDRKYFLTQWTLQDSFRNQTIHDSQHVIMQHRHPHFHCCPFVLRLNGFLLKMNHAGARTWMAECGPVSWFPNLKVNSHFLPFLCNCCCCPPLLCWTSLSNVTSEPRLESR